MSDNITRQFERAERGDKQAFDLLLSFVEDRIMEKGREVEEAFWAAKLVQISEFMVEIWKARLEHAQTLANETMKLQRRLHRESDGTSNDRSQSSVGTSQG